MVRNQRYFVNYIVDQLIYRSIQLFWMETASRTRIESGATLHWYSSALSSLLATFRPPYERRNAPDGYHVARKPYIVSLGRNRLVSEGKAAFD
ncbi:hypothetical protein EVAR_58823_1 [Eumeta japonica]|uniref:Uncharacterized protein n=1 Tax=Eumeta variegata TaxID=151549 RepID=A0A4C1YKY2_EUMVA|nr:hypothetical protein EVAR_58823_1 [Eumeta japonica]